MEQREIPDAVVRFIVEKIDTVPHLEALLLLWDSAPKGWSAEEIAIRVYVSAERAREILLDLVRQHLVALESVAERFQYDGAWDESGELMRTVAATYRLHLVRMANLIHSKASPAVREFARAFQFKKDR